MKYVAAVVCVFIILNCNSRQDRNEWEYDSDSDSVRKEVKNVLTNIDTLSGDTFIYFTLLSYPSSQGRNILSSSELRVTASKYGRDTLLHGLTENFYPDGKILNSAHYVYGIRTGWMKEFKQDSVLERETEFFYVKGKEEKGRTIVYDSNGEVNHQESFLYDFKVLPKTGELESSSIRLVQIGIDSIHFKEGISLVTGDYDDFFRLRDSLSLRTSLINENFGIVKVCSSRDDNGSERIRGYLIYKDRHHYFDISE